MYPSSILHCCSHRQGSIILATCRHYMNKIINNVYIGIHIVTFLIVYDKESKHFTSLTINKNIEIIKLKILYFTLYTQLYELI